MKTTKIPDTIAEIAAEMASIAEFAVGSISVSSNTYKLKDGTVKKASPHYKFQSLGQRGKRKYRNIPERSLPRVQKLIENGKRLKALEDAYIRLGTDKSISSTLKKTPGD